MATNVRDPRSIITPDAFELSKELLGTPLARPSRRLWAMLIDLIVIGILTAVTASITLVLWGGVAVFLISMAFRSPGRSLGQVGSLLFRGATGCLGTTILIGVLIGYLAVGSTEDGGERLSEVADAISAEVGDDADGGFGLPALVGGLAGVAEFHSAADADEAVEAAARVFGAAAAASEEPLDPAAARDIFDEMVPDDAPWVDERDAVFERALAEAGVSGEPDETGGDVAVDEDEADEDPAGVESAVERVEALSDAEAFALFLDLRDGSRPDSLAESNAEMLELLEARLVAVVAADSVEALAGEIDDARDDLSRAERRADEAEEALESGQGGFRGLLRDIWEQAGSAIGLWSLYFTMALTLTGGQTVGKKMMGLRVLRLDGEPLTWWSSFERAGGYVAGIATGTLGFVQVFWDANRQCVHDKIVGTVVVVDGAEIEAGAWQEAWAAQKVRDPQ